ncbi:MAG: hypothetical protein JST21_15375 [Bacteroidetes bacterium]|nr:hypothetical protein [Bacteroidota bacterium]
MRTTFILLLILFYTGFYFNTQAQSDSDSVLVKPDSATLVNNGKKISLDSLPVKDSTKLKTKKKHDPNKATIRSAIIPGWGQAYNHEYWKIPIVYGALAVPGSLFIYNNKWYQRTRDAYNIMVNNGDTSKIYPVLKGIPPENLQLYRNSFRKDRDYSALFFLLVWGLNVVDATVFAQLKDFDVSDDLSMRLRPDFDPVSKSPSLSIALGFSNKPQKILPSSF